MTNILVVFGTRPEAIKLCPVVDQLRQHRNTYSVKVAVTAQHREMLDQVLQIFEVEPEYDLDLMTRNQSLSALTARCVVELEKVIVDAAPDILLVQGDTTTTFAAALAAYYQQIAVGHVEAGLRTYQKYSPFPEEVNRRLTSTIADLHFAPTTTNRDNLLREGVNADRIVVTGNTVIDALLAIRKKLPEHDDELETRIGIDSSRRMILITGHRRESFGEKFEQICNAIRELAVAHPEVDLVYPVHLNPNVRTPVFEKLSGLANIKLIEPLDYTSFVYLMGKAYFIISDSGGIQEEAPSLDKPVLVTRDTTERPEALEANAIRLVGASQAKILREAQQLLNDPAYYASMAAANNPYGDGKASEKIVEALDKFVNEKA